MSTSKESSTGIGDFGSVIAAIISYAKWHSVGWAILHFLCGWVYVIYFLIRKY